MINTQTEWTVLSDGLAISITIVVEENTLWLTPSDFAAVSGWQVKEHTLCRDDRCLPLSLHAHLQNDDGLIDLLAFAHLQQIPLVRDDAHQLVSLGTAVEEQEALQKEGLAPDFTLPDQSGVLHSLSDYRGKKVLLVVWASWCGCREDLPLWQSLYERYCDNGLMVVTVAADARNDDAIPHIQAARPQHPALIDNNHIVSRRYGFINVPTVMWIDEQGRIARPPRVEHASNKFQFVHKLDCDPHLQALQRWVEKNETDFSEAETQQHIPVPTFEEQLARAQHALASYLYQAGEHEAAKQYWEQAIALSPHDWTIRRGSMWLRGEDPFGMDFFKVWEEWEQAGKPDYISLAAERKKIV
jgi:peroxiredoxin